jgi:pyruvate/2-oxoglutarate/acetoin dehydrogenase E1 component
MPRVLESLNQGLHSALSSNESVFLLGEDILDPYGGAFKVARGLSTDFPDRVLTTPVSEAGFLGVASGMALRGLRPVVEIMFGDFITLAADQIINHLSKFRYMYNDQVSVPIVIRTPMGGRRGYGPTHSQTLEKIFLGIPGLKILAASHIGDPGRLLYDAIIIDNDPVIFIEHKILYSLPLVSTGIEGDLQYEPVKTTNSSADENFSNDYAPTYKINIIGAPQPSVTLATYGYMADICTRAIIQLAFENEIFCELIVFTQLSPFSLLPLHNSVRGTSKLLVVEEGTYTMGWGAEIIARVVEEPAMEIHAAARIASADSPIPASISLEQSVLPDIDDVIQAVQLMV